MCHRGQSQGRPSRCERGKRRCRRDETAVLSGRQLKFHNAEPGQPVASMSCEITCVKVYKLHGAFSTFIDQRGSRSEGQWGGWAWLSAVLWERHVISYSEIQSTQYCCLPVHQLTWSLVVYLVVGAPPSQDPPQQMSFFTRSRFFAWLCLPSWNIQGFHYVSHYEKCCCAKSKYRD